MAYYEDGYKWPQEYTTYDQVDYQDSVSFSGYESYDLDTYDTYTVSEFHEPKFTDHYYQPDDYNYEHNYDHSSYMSASPEMNYFAYNYMEPKLIAYEPVVCDTGYISYSISYNSKADSGFNEPEFEEYDSTPYGGGYDIVSVYGKPLPPSDKICYPRSKPKPIGPNPGPMSKPAPKPIPIPPIVPEPEPEHKPRPNPESALVPVLTPPPKHDPVSTPTPITLVDPEPKHVNLPVPVTEPLGLIEVRESELTDHEYSYPNYGYDYPWPEYDYGYGVGVGVGYDYGYGKQMIQVSPIEYDPEVVDLCENLFGSWPCLARIRRQQMEINNNAEITYPKNGQLDPLEGCANYIFGHQIASCNH